MGTSPLYAVAGALSRVLKHPFLLGSVANLWGYFSSLVRRAPRYEDPAFRRFVRQYQHRCLLYGKRRATRWLNEMQAAVWRAAHEGASPSSRSSTTGDGTRQP